LGTTTDVNPSGFQARRRSPSRPNLVRLDYSAVRLDYSAAVGMIRAMLKRRKLSGWTQFMTIYTVAVCGLFVLLVFLYDWFFRDHPWG